MSTRRTVLKVMGGGLIVAAGVGGLWSATRDPAGARAPWANPGQDSDPRRRALSYAILAPNPHNRQPWLVDLSTPDEATLYCQLDRRLEHTDPFDRQITVGLGAFLELMTMAAAKDGYRVDITPFPDGEPSPRLDSRPVARLRFTIDATVRPDPLFAQVLARRTNRTAYDTARPVSADTLARIAVAAKGTKAATTNEPDRVKRLRDLAWRAMHLELTTPAPAKESVDLTRIGRAEIEANPDGISIAGPLMEGLSTLGLMNRQDLLVPQSELFRQQLEFLRQPFETAMAFVWLASDGNTRLQQLQAGRDYVRLNLAATEQGVAMQPYSQALQEYPAMAPLYSEIRTELGATTAQTVQMFARLGYADALPGSPRWPHTTRIKGA